MKPRMVNLYIATLVMLGCFVSHSVSATVELTNKQRAYLTEKKLINLCTDPNWLPYEGIDVKGEFTGIMSDFYTLWAAKIGTPIKLVPTSSWEQSLQLIRNGKCDILSSAQYVPSRHEWLRVSNPFIFYPLAVATQPDHDFIVKFEQILDRDFVMASGYAGVEILRNHYPKINITTVETPQLGLKKVESGQYFAYIDTVPTINYQMLRWGISHLKISAVLDLQYAMSVGVSTSQLPLLEIFNKAIADTTDQERQQILNRWLSIDYPAENHLPLWIILIGVIVLMVLIYRYRQIHHHNRNLLTLNTQLEHISLNDHLTGLANRYALHQRFDVEIDLANQSQHTFSLILLDVDNFKIINDQYGHDAGDNVIREFSDLLTSIVRENDLVGRWGGEEFLIICSKTSNKGVLRLAEELRQLVENNNFSVDQPMTASFGLSEYRQGETITDTIKRADDALYRAKHNGRNQIVISDSQ